MSFYGPLTEVAIYEAPVLSTRIVEDRFGTLYVQYEYSRRNNQWRFHTARNDDMSHPATYGSMSAARACARRIITRNNQQETPT